MKKIYVFIAAIAFLTAACRKDTGTISPLNETKTNPQDVINNAPAPCSGNDWDLDADYLSNGLAFVYDNKLYVPHHQSMTVKIFDGTSWTSIPSDVPFRTYSYPTGYSIDIVAFTIGSKGYMFLPYRPITSVYGFWEYNFVTNAWTRKADFPGELRHTPAYFSVGNKGYVVGGYQSNGTDYFTDTWQYNQQSNSWAQKASLEYVGRDEAVGFNIGSKGYIVGGKLKSSGDPLFTKQLLEYDPSTNDWTVKAWFPGAARARTGTFVIGDKAYAGGGYGGWTGSGYTYYQDYYKYSPATNSWTRVADLPLDFHSFFGFSINSRGYMVLNFGSYGNGMVKYTPAYCFPGSSQ